MPTSWPTLKRLSAAAYLAAAVFLSSLPAATAQGASQNAAQADARRPMAVWQYQGQFAIIDGSGAVIARENFTQFGPLPLVVGEGADRHAAEILELLSWYPAILQRVHAPVRVGDRRWNLRLSNGLDVQLPIQDQDTAFRMLASMQGAHGVLDRQDLAAIDMRDLDRIVLHLKADGGAAPVPPQAAAPPASPPPATPRESAPANQNTARPVSPPASQPDRQSPQPTLAELDCREDAGWAETFARRRDVGMGLSTQHAEMRLALGDNRKAQLYGFILIAIYEQYPGRRPAEIREILYGQCIRSKQRDGR